MAISFVAATGNSISATQSFNALMPAGLQDGDLLLVFVVTQTLHDSSGTPPTNVNKVLEQDNTTGADCSLSVFRKIAASEGASIAFTNIFAANEAGRVITMAYRGVDQTTPMDTTAVSGNESGTAWDTTAIVPVTNNAVLVACMATDPGANPMTFAWDSPATERIDSDTTPSGQNELVGWLGIADRTVSPAASTTMGGDSSSSQTAAWAILALRPAPGDFPLDAQDDAYTVTGTAATVVATRLIGGEPGSYAFTGVLTTLLAARLVAADPGVYAVTGFDTDLVYTPAGDFTVNAASGTFTVTGTNASTLAARAIDIAPGAYAVTGTTATFESAVLPAFPAGPSGYIADYGRGRIREPVEVVTP